MDRWCSGVHRPTPRKLVDETLEIVGLSGLRERYPAQLSGGQKQRVALARAIVCEPKVILLDEPLAALDANLRRQMQVFLKQIQRRIQTTFVFVTHDQDEAITMSDRIVVMSQGRIEQQGTPKDLYYRPRTRFVAGFFGDNNLIDGAMAEPGVVATALGLLPAAGAANVATGRKVLLAIRPEHLRLGQGQARIPAAVEEVMFGGAMTRLLAGTEAAPGFKLDVRLTGEDLDQSLAGRQAHHAHLRSGKRRGHRGVSHRAVPACPLADLCRRSSCTAGPGRRTDRLVPAAVAVSRREAPDHSRRGAHQLRQLLRQLDLLRHVSGNAAALPRGDPAIGRARLPDRLVHLAPARQPALPAPPAGGGAAVHELYRQALYAALDARTQRTAQPMLLGLGVLDRPSHIFLFNQRAVLITMAVIYLPFVILPIFLALERIPRSLLHASVDLGAGAWATFRRVVLPLSLPGTIAGALFAFVLALGDFITPQMVGGTTGFTIGRVIFSQFGLAYDWPFGAAMAAVLLAVALAGIAMAGFAASRQRV